MESEIRSKTGVTIVGIIHNDIFRPNPDALYPFGNGDIIAIVGSAIERDAFRKLAKASEGEYCFISSEPKETD